MSIARYVQEMVNKFTAGRQAQLPQRRHKTAAAAVTSPCHCSESLDRQAAPQASD